jgi:hypothetical protein
VSDTVPDLGEISRLASTMLAHLTPAERRRTLRTIARAIQKSQRTRIAAQKEPDGEPFKPRKAKPVKEGNHPLKFLYPKGEDKPRVCLVKRWVHAGKAFTGFDVEVGAMRTFDWDKVARYLPMTAADEAKPAGPMPKRGRLRSKAMFRKLRGARFLKAGASSEEAWAGFDGRAAKVARPHQDGGQDEAGPGGRLIRYPRRTLIGLTPADREKLAELVIGAVAP